MAGHREFWRDGRIVQLEVVGGDGWSALTRLWAAALNDVVVRHPTGEPVRLVLVDAECPVLRIQLDQQRDSRDPSNVFKRFIYSNVRLSYFPGVKLAREWLAAAWGGAMQHEALELVTVGGLKERPLDPHEPPFAYDRGLRDGMPTDLNPATLIQALAVVMPTDAAVALAGGG